MFLQRGLQVYLGPVLRLHLLSALLQHAPGEVNGDLLPIGQGVVHPGAVPRDGHNPGFGPLPRLGSCAFPCRGQQLLKHQHGLHTARGYGRRNLDSRSGTMGRTFGHSCLGSFGLRGTDLWLVGLLARKAAQRQRQSPESDMTIYRKHAYLTYTPIHPKPPAWAGTKAFSPIYFLVLRPLQQLLPIKQV